MTTTELAVRENSALPIALQVFGAERITVLKDLIAKGATDAELEMLALIAQRTRLDPFAKQIYAIKRWDSKERRDVMTIQVGIDGLRLIAARTGQYQGQVGPQWCGPDGVWRDVWLTAGNPAAARVGVHRKGFREAIWGVAVWDRAKQTYSPKDGTAKLMPMWERMGAEMLAKVAEANALRRAFPAETSGLVVADAPTVEDEESYRARQTVLAGRYDEIFGTDEPATTERNGRTVDTTTGEVLQDTRPSQPAPPKRKAPSRPADEPITSIDDPLYKRYSEVYRDAVSLGITPDIQGLTDGLTVGELTKRGEELKAQVDAARAKQLLPAEEEAF